MSRGEPPKPDEFRVDIAPAEHVTARAYPAAADARTDVTLILAHGAGADQASGFMVHFANELAARGIDTVTFNFAYMEARKRVPDRNDKLESCYRSVIAAIRERQAGASGPLAIGGKSMGGRIASQVAAKDRDGIAGLVFLGYPLHPPGRPDQLRTRHWSDIRAPMLFVQGSRDTFGTPDELRPHMQTLKAPADLCVVEDGDHSFKVRRKAPLTQAQTQAQVYDFMLDEIVRWLRSVVAERA
jgi:predicted alpha/beta-hydrolase family hydrolase